MSIEKNPARERACLELKTLFSGRETKVSFSRSFPLSSDLLEVSLAGEVSVQGVISDYSGVLQFQADFSVPYTAKCDRCLADLSRVLTFSLDRPVSKTPASEDEEEETVFAENDIIDLAALCVSGIIENLPFKHLCSFECKGLCPYCGTDLNQAACSCKAPPDPRLAGLAEFFHE